MCFFKLNRFHWHLTDNEAWRVELECYHNLTKVGAFRGYNHSIPPFYGNGYNKNEIKAFAAWHLDNIQSGNDSVFTAYYLRSMAEQANW